MQDLDTRRSYGLESARPSPAKGPRRVPVETFPTTCWNCLGEFDALNAVWCSDDPKNPTKLCPFCFRCFCAASEKYKQEFWSKAPQRMQDELATLQQEQGPAGRRPHPHEEADDAAAPGGARRAEEHRQAAGRDPGRPRASSRPTTSRSRCARQGVSPLTDTMGIAYAANPVWEQQQPRRHHPLHPPLAARKGASDVQIEPKEDAVSVKYRIDGFFFRVDPIPKPFQPALTQKLLELFRLDPARRRAPAEEPHHRCAWPTSTTTSSSRRCRPRRACRATIKLVNRATFLKDLTTLGLHIEDRVRLHGGAARLVRPGAGDGARLQRRQHHRVLDHELPGPRPARRGVARVAHPLAGRGRAPGRGRGRRARAWRRRCARSWPCGPR